MQRRRYALQLLSTAFFLLSFVGLSEQADAQFSFTIREGLPTALSSAQGTIGDDAVLVFAGTTGSLEFQGIGPRFDLDDGESTLWAYVFYSPSSRQLASVLVVRILRFQAIPLNDLPFPIPAGLTNEASLDGTYGNSDDLVERLATDNTFSQYRSDLPDVSPSLVSIAHLVDIDNLELPNGFPLDQPTWTVSFMGSGDSSMTCFVASETGEVLCRRLNTSSVDTDNENQIEMIITPNLSVEHVVIRLPNIYEAPSTSSQTSLLVYNILGDVVADLSSRVSEVESGLYLDISDFAPGAYFCKLSGPEIDAQSSFIISQ